MIAVASLLFPFPLAIGPPDHDHSMKIFPTGPRTLLWTFLLLFIVASIHYEAVALVPRTVVHRLPGTKPSSNSLRKECFPLNTLSVEQEGSDSYKPSLVYDYWNSIRPYTIMQAVGALIVGRLALASHAGNVLPFVAASLSVYLSYGAGMAMNDCADVDTDALSITKQDRAIASGRISKQAGWRFCSILGVLSIFLASVLGQGYCIWNASNMLFMLGYALNWQRVFLLKNIICGWLAISPLIGAALWTGAEQVSWTKLGLLAVVGFPIQVAREILKDIEDVKVDQGKKVTLPLVVGEKRAHRIAYGIVGMVCSAMVFSKSYWKLFASNPPVYTFGVIAGVPMCIRASLLPLKRGEQLLKKSIYVLLVGMIGGLVMQ